MGGQSEEEKRTDRLCRSAENTSREQPLQGLSSAHEVRFIFKMLTLAAMCWVWSGDRNVSREVEEEAVRRLRSCPRGGQQRALPGLSKDGSWGRPRFLGGHSDRQNEGQERSLGGKCEVLMQQLQQGMLSGALTRPAGCISSPMAFFSSSRNRFSFETSLSPLWPPANSQLALRASR